MKNWILITLAALMSSLVVAFSQPTNLPTLRRLMTARDFKACGLSKLNAEELAALDQWMETRLRPVAELIAQNATRAPRASFSFDDLLGCSIEAHGGQFLGVISRNTMDPKSILNTVGSYGSTVGSKSIFCTVGRYGSTVSPASAFCTAASNPPRILAKDGKFVAYLTKNPHKSPSVDPSALVSWLKSH